ncbi:MAG: WG repeat-containing protein [Bacteroidia bacterium]|nr:WG repeat-containing protein [Bacteroidia bacterium]
MKISLIILVFSVTCICCCSQKSITGISNNIYYDKQPSDTAIVEKLIAVTDEEFRQYGSRVAYLNSTGDTVIPFNRYTYLGTDTLTHFANVLEYPKDSSYGRWIAIDRNQNTLYDLVFFDNGPDDFREGLVRVKRNGKMGFADEYGRITIPCAYDFAWWFENGKAKVTYKAKEIRDKYEEHFGIASDEWFYIDKKGKEIN